MPPEVPVCEYEHNADRDTDRATSNHVQTAGYSADGDDCREGDQKQPAGADDPHSLAHRCFA
jgi:hypothetical protein